MLRRMEALARQVSPGLLRLATWALLSSATGRRTDLLGLRGVPTDDEIDEAVPALPARELPAVNAALLAAGLLHPASALRRMIC